MFSKIPHISYPGELPDLDHQTISLRTQLRLSYETYPWVRYLIWSGLLLLAVLLVILPGFPPQVALLCWQNLQVIGPLIKLHGVAALFSLLALGLQTLTWLVCWLVLITICNKLVRYTWRMHSTQQILAAGWLSSSALANDKASITLARTEPLAGKYAPDAQNEQQPQTVFTRPVTSADAPFARFPRAQADSSGRVPAHSPVDSSSQVLVRSLADSSGRVPARPQVNSVADSAGRVPARPQVNSAAQASADSSISRQFAQPNMAPARSRMPPSGEISSGWPFNPAGSGPGIAWDPGIKRKGRPNEDSVLTMRGTCNFGERLLPFELHIVADGMGGHAQGRLASHLAIRSMLETVIPGLVASNEIESEQIVDTLIDGVHWANQVIYQYGQEHSVDMGTTVTAVLLLDDVAYIINVGDSRTYIYRPSAGLTQITRDHSLVARLVETGAITPDEIYTHPDRNKVYRGLGDKTDVTVDWFVLPIQNNDMLLLCSDGLWEMVRDPQIAEILQAYANSPTLASNALLRAALQGGGSDNVSSLVVRVA